MDWIPKGKEGKGSDGGFRALTWVEYWTGMPLQTKGVVKPAAKRARVERDDGRGGEVDDPVNDNNF